jgi:hypothetical protein
LGQISINKTKAVKKISLINISLNKTIVIDISLEVVLNIILSIKLIK